MHPLKFSVMSLIKSNFHYSQCNSSIVPLLIVLLVVCIHDSQCHRAQLLSCDVICSSHGISYCKQQTCKGPMMMLQPSVFTLAASHPKVVVISSFLHPGLTPGYTARNIAREAD